MQRWLAATLGQWALPPAAAFAVDLVINEAVTNSILHARPGSNPHDIHLTLTDTPESVVVEIVDSGEAFNPLDAPPMVLAENLEQAAVAGRGIHLIKAYADEHAYRRIAEHNCLTLAIHKDRKASRGASA